MKKIIVAGASGFLGRHLTRYFNQRGWDVVGFWWGYFIVCLVRYSHVSVASGGHDGEDGAFGRGVPKFKRVGESCAGCLLVSCGGCRLVRLVD